MDDHRELVLEATSPENIEVVREHVQAYVRRDVEAMRRLSSADLELDWSASKGWLAAVYRGFEEVVRVYADYYAHFDEIMIEIESYTSTGDHVVVPNIAYQRGRDGIEVTARSTFVFTVWDRRITRICLYQETSAALAAVGVGTRLAMHNLQPATQSVTLLELLGAQPRERPARPPLRSS